jgi:hypothetical protein
MTQNSRSACPEAGTFWVVVGHIVVEIHGRPPEVRPLVWQPVQATRPALSVVSRSPSGCSQNVGSRFGVGP